MAPRSTELRHALIERTFKTFASDELVMMCGAHSEPTSAQDRWHMMSRHPHCDGKLHFNVYRMDKLLACGVNGKLQSSLPMPSWSKHCSSDKPAVRAANHIGEGGRTHRDDQRSEQQRWHNLMSKVPIRRAGHGQEGARRRAARAQTALPSQDLLRAIAHRHQPDD